MRRQIHSVPLFYLPVPSLFNMTASALFFVTGCALYALFSEPTPNDPGLPELLIAACLFSAILLTNNLARFSPCILSTNVPNFIKWGIIFVYSVFPLALTIGLLNGNTSSAIVRDIIGLTFWLSPVLFINPHFQKNARLLVTGCLVLIGLCFSARFLISIYTVTGTLTIAPAHPEILLELVNVPSVLFTALYLFGLGVVHLQYDAPSRSKGLLYLGLSALPITAGICALQRANMGSVVLLGGALVLLQIWRRPGKSLWSIGALAICIAMIWPLFWEVLALMIEKTRLVGFNMRFEEAEAILKHMYEINTMSLLTGLGFGAGFVSPAAGLVEINFTHNFFMTLCLKFGIIGLVLGTLYILSLVYPIAHQIIFSALPQKRIVLLSAIILPVLVNLFLYANHKSFDFGLLLLLAVLTGAEPLNRSKHQAKTVDRIEEQY